VTEAGNPDSLAKGILEVLKNPGYRQWLIDNAYADLEWRFNWPKLASQTEKVYQRVVTERSQVEW
jgi:glycosyltransferase involved in cell wall biosynthesis